MAWYSDEELERLWEELEDVPFDEDERGALILTEDWNGFKKGEEQLEIWRWFDEHHSRGVHYLLYGIGGM